LSNNLPELSV